MNEKDEIEMNLELFEKEEIKGEIIELLEIASEIVDETKAFKAQGIRDIRISTFAVANILQKQIELRIENEKLALGKYRMLLD